MLRKEALYFWRNNIGKLDETRWDVFEENIRVFMEENIREVQKYFKVVSLIDFFLYLKVKIFNEKLV